MYVYKHEYIHDILLVSLGPICVNDNKKLYKKMHTDQTFTTKRLNSVMKSITAWFSLMWWTPLSSLSNSRWCYFACTESVHLY